MPKKLDRRLLKQTLYGYQVVNRLTEAERHSWLEHLSLEEARQIFADLHKNADDWKKNGGDLETLERRRLAGKINGRRINLLLAKQQGLV